MITRANGRVNGTPFIFEFDGDTLTVKHESHADDHCAGQHEVRSAWFKAAEELGLVRACDFNHSGGWILAETMPADETVDA